MPFLIFLLGLLAIVAAVAVVGLSIWALAFGIFDIVNVGVNFWAIVWIILGALGLFGAFSRNR